MECIENDCVGCDIPCVDCGRKHVKHFYCDDCGDEEQLYEYNGKQLCELCLLSYFKVVEGSGC